MRKYITKNNGRVGIGIECEVGCTCDVDTRKSEDTWGYPTPLFVSTNCQFLFFVGHKPHLMNPIHFSFFQITYVLNRNKMENFFSPEKIYF